MTIKRLTKQSKVTFVELPAYQFGILNGELCYDEYSYYRLPARAIHTLEGVLREDGWSDVRSVNPLFHGENGKCSEKNFRRMFSSDVLGISYITRTAPQSLRLARLAKLVNPNITVLLGGDHATANPEEALEYGDIVFLKEGEMSMTEVMNQLTKDRYELDDIGGIGFNRNGDQVLTGERELMSPGEMSQMPHPHYDEETRRGINIGVMETTRGCPNRCKFCSVWKNCGGSYRTKSVDFVVEGFRRIQGLGTVVFITDNNFSANPKYLRELSYEMQRTGLNRGLISAQVDARGSEGDRIESLKRIGVKFLYVGFESNNDDTLENLGKPFDSRKNEEAAKAYNDAGFFVHGMFIIGPNDTRDTINELLEFAKRYTHTAQFFPLCPAPGTETRQLMQQQNRILSNDWHLYEGHHVLLRPDGSANGILSPYEMQLQIHGMYEDYYSFTNSLKRLTRSPSKIASAGVMIYTGIMKGIKRVTSSPQTLDHLKLLRAIS